MKRLYEQAHVASRSSYVTMMHCSRTVCIRAFNVRVKNALVHTPRSSDFPHVALTSSTYQVHHSCSQLQTNAALTFGDSQDVPAGNLVPDRKGTAALHGRPRRLIAEPYNHAVASSAPCVLHDVDVVATGRLPSSCKPVGWHEIGSVSTKNCDVQATWAKWPEQSMKTASTSMLP